MLYKNWTCEGKPYRRCDLSPAPSASSGVSAASQSCRLQLSWWCWGQNKRTLGPDCTAPWCRSQPCCLSASWRTSDKVKYSWTFIFTYGISMNWFKKHNWLYVCEEKYVWMSLCSSFFSLLRWSVSLAWLWWWDSRRARCTLGLGIPSWLSRERRRFLFSDRSSSVLGPSVSGTKIICKKHIKRIPL